MSDGKYFLTKVMEVFKADTTLHGLVADRVKVSHFTPIDNTYPQITLFMDLGRSEAKFPAGHYIFCVTVWADKNVVQPYKTVMDIVKSVNRLINRKANSVTEINLLANTGLRTVKCLKNGGEIEEDTATGKFRADIEFDVVISEDENFSVSGNPTWA